MNKTLNFIGKSKIFFGISLALLLIGLVCNLIFGTTLDISFTGGTEVNYSYTGEVDEAKMTDILQTATEDTVSFSHGSSFADGSSSITVKFSGNKTITPDLQKDLLTQLQKAFPESSFSVGQSNSVEPSMGIKFLWKCIAAVALASILMVIYVAFRFKKIGGWSAGAMALVALLHDVLMVYFTFIVLRMPIDSNFVAVALMLLGYSLNDTIVIYDRVRENRAILGRKADVAEVFNLSASQVMRRTICTSLTTLATIACVLVVAIIFNLTSIYSFALPMMVGIVFGCYSSICIAGPLWVLWQKREKKEKKK